MDCMFQLKHLNDLAALAGVARALLFFAWISNTARRSSLSDVTTKTWQAG
jgi:HAMP domain-containing protein